MKCKHNPQDIGKNTIKNKEKTSIFVNPEDYKIMWIKFLILNLGLEIERSIKSFVIGRKNWIFSNTPRGAHASAGMYSIIESAKLNGLNPYLYLRFLLSKLPTIGDNREELRKHLPCFVTAEEIKISD